MFTTKLSLRVKFLEMLLISKDNNVAKLKRKCNWDAGFNSSMIQDLCIKLIYLRNREQKDLEITHISRFSSCSIPLWRLFFFFILFLILSFLCTSVIVLVYVNLFHIFSLVHVLMLYFLKIISSIKVGACQHFFS